MPWADFEALLEGPLDVIDIAFRDPNRPGAPKALMATIFSLDARQRGLLAWLTLRLYVTLARVNAPDNSEEFAKAARRVAYEILAASARDDG